MRRLLLALVVAAPLTGAEAHDGSPRFHLGTGVGMPELVHGELGIFARPRLSVDLRVANAALNPMIGTGVTYLVGRAAPGDTPRHALLLRLHGMINPTLNGLRLTSAGDTLGAYVTPEVGYGFLAGNGFSLRVSAGALLAAERFDPVVPGEAPPLPPGAPPAAQVGEETDFNLAAGPHLSLSLGWAF